MKKSRKKRLELWGYQLSGASDQVSVVSCQWSVVANPRPFPDTWHLS